jgi:RNA polymerase sigma-70 factor (ECF subfamily)
MKHLILALLLTAVVAQAQNPAKLTVENMPPSVIKTVPQAGDTNVDPGLKEVTVTFSKDMLTNKMWAWCSQTPDTFPEIDAKNIRFLKDKRTCVLPVKLQPGKTYIIWINTYKLKAFQDTNKNPAMPYLLVFQTTSAADIKAAADAAEKWLKLADEGKYGESWDIAADFFKKSTPRKRCEYVFGKMREECGKKVSREFSARSCHNSMPNAPDGKYIEMEFKSSFDNKLSAVETITAMLDKDGKWRIAGYYIN